MFEGKYNSAPCPKDTMSHRLLAPFISARGYPIFGLTLSPNKKSPLPTVEVSLSHVVHYSPRNKSINGFTAGKALPDHGGRNIRGFGVNPHEAGESFLGQSFCHIFMTLPVPNPSNGKEGAVAHRFFDAAPRIKGFG